MKTVLSNRRATLILILLATFIWGCGETESDPDDTEKENEDDTETESEPEGNGGDAGPSDKSCDEEGEGDDLFYEQYMSAEIPVAGSDKSYIIHTNWWGAFEDQTVAYDGLSFEVGNPSDVSVGLDEGAPIGYPSMFIGTYAGNESDESNLPIAVTEISSIATSFHTNAVASGLSNKNASYDVWLTADGDPLPDSQYSPGRGGAYLMVWLFKPSDRQPRGTNDVPAHTIEGVPGKWDVWIDNTDPPCISYVSTEPLDGLDFDLNDFIQDSVQNDYGVTDEMFLSIIFAGFEIWGGGDGLKVERFCADVR